MVETPPILYESRQSIARICFSRPDLLNAIDARTAAAFCEICQTVSRDSAIRVIVLRGAGRGFMAGGDLRRFLTAPERVADEIIDPLHHGLQLLVEHPAPTLASLHGPVAGAGLSIAAACDMAIAADDTRFTFAYSRVGVSCDAGASWSLPRLIGLRRALQLAFLDEPLSAEDALRIGLVNEVVPLAELEERTDSVAARITAAPPLALSALKRLMRTSFERGFAAQLAEERESFRRLVQTEDCRKAVVAFFEKRTASYSGL